MVKQKAIRSTVALSNEAESREAVWSNAIVAVQKGAAAPEAQQQL